MLMLAKSKVDLTLKCCFQSFIENCANIVHFGSGFCEREATGKINVQPCSNIIAVSLEDNVEKHNLRAILKTCDLWVCLVGVHGSIGGGGGGVVCVCAGFGGIVHGGIDDGVGGVDGGIVGDGGVVWVLAPCWC